MNKLILAGAAALAFAAPSFAQDMAMDNSGNVYSMSPTQQSMYDNWPPERQTTYTAWPDTYKTYYWTLTPSQANGWWVLTDDQRARVYGMTPEQRVAAWTAIEKQMAGMPASNSSAMASSATSSAGMAGNSANMGNMRFVSNPMMQQISADAPPANPPICNKGETDNCINAWEAGKRGPGVNRPLGYWPGKPASGM